MKWLNLIVLISLLAGCAVTLSTPHENQFKKTIVIRDDPTQNAVVFSTIKGGQEKQMTTGQVWNDNFLRGFIDKRTGGKTYQVYNVVYYGGSGAKASWKHFKQASYDMLRGVKLTPTTILREDENCSALTVYGQCVYNEHVTFKVTDQLFEAMSTMYQSESAKEWQYTLISESRESHRDIITIAEIAGLLASMNEYELPKTSSEKSASEMIDSSSLPEPLVIPPVPEEVLKLRKPH